MKQDPIHINRETYDRVAADFSARRSEMNDNLIQRAARLKAEIQPGGRVLDLGCGAGRDLAWFVQNGVNAIGADQSAGMLALARRAGSNGLFQMEMRRLGFADHSFAGVWCNAALLHIPRADAPQVLAEIRRVLIPGGRFFVSLQKGAGEGLEPYPNDAAQSRFFARYDAPEMAALLEQAGFAILRQEEYLWNRLWLWFETEKQAKEST